MDGGWMTMQRGLGGRESGGQEDGILPTGRWPVVRGPLTLSSGPDQSSKGCDSPTRGPPKSQRRGLRGGEHSGLCSFRQGGPAVRHRLLTLLTMLGLGTRG